MAKTGWYGYTIMLRPEPEGGFTALVPARPGCVTYGRTLKQAREMAKDALSGYIAGLRKHTTKPSLPTTTLSSHLSTSNTLAGDAAVFAISHVRRQCRNP